MKVKVSWIGFHDGGYHESDVMSSVDEVKDFINVLGDPESSTSSLINVETGERITFQQFIEDSMFDNNQKNIDDIDKFISSNYKTTVSFVEPEGNLINNNLAVYTQDRIKNDSVYISEKGYFFGIYNTSKKSFLDEKDISADCAVHNIGDNPFDVMLFFSLELVKDMIFASSRYRNPKVPESLYVCPDHIESKIDIILNQLSKLEKVNPDTIKFLRKFSFGCNAENGICEYLNNLENKLNTIYNRSVPCRDIEYEKIRCGENSKYYKRLLFLRNIVDSGEFTEKIKSHAIDVIDNDKKCIEFGWCSEEDYSNIISFLSKYDLNSDEIEYMIEYTKNKK